MLTRGYDRSQGYGRSRGYDRSQGDGRSRGYGRSRRGLLGLELLVPGLHHAPRHLVQVAPRRVQLLDGVQPALGLEPPYTEEDIRQLMLQLELPLAYVGKIQQARHRYWIMKHLETKVGQRVGGLVLDRFKNEYSVLLPDYLLECRLPMPPSTSLKPKDTIQLTVQHVNARNDIISVFCS